MAEIIEPEMLQQLMEKLKTLELSFNRGIDRLQGILRETRKKPEESPHQNQKRPEAIPIMRLTPAEMVARREKGLCYSCDEVYKFGHQCTKRQIFMFKEEEESDEEEEENTENVVDSGGKLIDVQDPEDSANKEISGSDLVSPIKLNLPEFEGDEPEHKPETRSLVKEIKLPDSEIATYLVKSQEATIEADSEAKKATSEAKNTKPWPKPDPNRNSDPTLSYQNQIVPPIQTQSFHAVNQNTVAFLDANRPEPWPNKPSINTNPNRPNPWPNKLPTLTYFIRPKPWAGDHPICTVPKPRTGSNETKKFGKQTRRRSYQFQPWVRTKSDGQLSVFPVTNHARQRNQHRFWSTHSRADAIELLIAIHRTSWTAATTTTSFPEVNRLRSKPKSQLMVLLVFDPGDFHSKEEEGKISFDFNGDLGHFGRFFEGDRRRIEASGRRFSERRRIKNEEEARASNDLNWGFYSNDKLLFCEGKRIGCHFNRDLRLGEERVRKWGVVLMEVCREKEEDLCCVEGRRNEEEKLPWILSERREVFKGLTPPNPNSKRCHFGALVIGLVGAHCGKPGQKHKWADWAALQVTISSAFGESGNL